MRFGIKFQYIMDWCNDQDTSEPNLRVAGYLTYLLGCTLFINKSLDRILSKFADVLLQDPAHINQYAWGPAALVYLYRKLDEATRAESRQLSGCLDTFGGVYIRVYFMFLTWTKPFLEGIFSTITKVEDICAVRGNTAEADEVPDCIRSITCIRGALDPIWS